MNSLVKEAVSILLAKTSNAKLAGRIIGSTELQELQARLTVPLPDWYVELLSTYPLSGAHLDYPSWHNTTGRGYERLRLARMIDIFNETEECYPGLAIRDLGYACLAIDPTGGGDPYFMRVVDGDNPPVFQVYHDVSDIGTVIEQEGIVKIADSLAELFTDALPRG